MDSLAGRLLADEDGRIRSGWKALGFALLHNLLASLAALVHPAHPAASPDWLPHEWLSGAVVLLAAWLCLRAEGAGFGSMGLDWSRRRAAHLAGGAALGFLLMLLTALVGRAFGAFHWVRTPGGGSGGLLLGLWLYAAVAFHEELLFRGYAFFRLKDGAGALPAILATSALFIAAHWNNPGMSGATRAWAAVNIGLAGLLLGLCAWRSGGLALPMGLHLGWNWTQGSLLGFGVSGTEAKGYLTPVFDGRPDWLSGNTFGLEASLPCALLCAAACVAVASWPRRHVPTTSAPQGEAA